MRARAVIEEKESSNKSQIVVTELPYQVNKAKLVQDIADLVMEKKLEGISAQRRKATQAMGAAASEYDRLCDETLVYPHASEIWSAEPALSYLPTGRRLGDAVELVIEEVRPTADYEAAWKPIAAALAQAKYPVERRSFFSSYGTGRVLSFWLAPSAAVLRAAPTVAQALESVVGAERAQALMSAWHACVLSSQTLAVEPKPEMTSF